MLFVRSAIQGSHRPDHRAAARLCLRRGDRSEQGKIVSLIVPGQKKLGGLLSGDDDYILPWESISRLGEDIILAEVAAQQPRRRREKRQNYL